MYKLKCCLDWGSRGLQYRPAGAKQGDKGVSPCVPHGKLKFALYFLVLQVLHDVTEAVRSGDQSHWQRKLCALPLAPSNAAAA